MLKKLIKYDMKFIGRIVPMVYLAALAVSLLMSAMIYLASVNEMLTVLPVLTLFPFCLVISAISVSGFIMIAIRIYKNLYSDEGYLTFTLPVTVNQQIFSKVISGAIWAVLGLLVAVICIIIPLVTAYFSFGIFELDIRTILDYAIFVLRETFADVSAQMIALAVIGALFLIISVFATPVTLLFAFSVGQSSKNHRVLTSMLVYFGINIILSTITSIVQAIIEFPYIDAIASSDVTAMMNMYLIMLSVSTVIYFIYYIVSYFYVKNVMTHKLNLL